MSESEDSDDSLTASRGQFDNILADAITHAPVILSPKRLREPGSAPTRAVSAATVPDPKPRVHKGPRGMDLRPPRSIDFLKVMLSWGKTELMTTPPPNQTFAVVPERFRSHMDYVWHFYPLLGACPGSDGWLFHVTCVLAWLRVPIYVACDKPDQSDSLGRLLCTRLSCLSLLGLTHGCPEDDRILLEFQQYIRVSLR